MNRPVQRSLRIWDAREHNLRGIDLELPLGQMIVVTGVSGSGKSSLVHDVIYREGQRRYLEGLSSYSRQFLGKLGRAAVGQITGLQAAVSVDQRTAISSPRSTVGTISELHPHLRLLLARAGEPHLSRGEQLESSLLSFNSRGACPRCGGLGVEDRVDPELLVGDPGKTVREGALVLTTPSGYLVYSQVTMDVLDQVCRAHDFTVDIAWERLSEDQRRVILFGSRRITIPFGKHPLESRLRWKGITARPRQEGHYKGIIPTIEEILRHKRNKNALRFVRSTDCSACGGARLSPEALAVTFRGRNMARLADLSVDRLERLACTTELTAAEEPAAAPLLAEIHRRCALLQRLGLGYLQLSRPSASLAGGEAQRIRLATQVRSGLRGLLYVLDEPSIGLHPRDLDRLLGVLRQLRDEGNTVLVVEHDEATMRGADWLVDVGPGAGEAGGRVLWSGPLEGLLEDDVDDLAASSRTRAYLRGEEAVAVPGRRRPGAGVLCVRGATARNLAGVDATFQLGAFNVVTGVSGSGKSTLVRQVLGRALARRLHGGRARPGSHAGLEGAGQVDKLIEIDQSPIGRTPRSNPATYTKVHDQIRAVLADQPEARERGWNKGRFSFNVKGGRCERCQGAGVQTVGMHYLADVEVLCEACHGRRFNEETLQVRYGGLSVADILELPVSRALELFSDRPRIRRVLQAMVDVGLGYLSLGQPATTLSGGEAQRVKLSAELGRPNTGKTLFILDEPTTGLHSADIQVLLQAVQGLVRLGNTAIVIEHNMDVVKTADWVVDLGPESGSGGGRIVAAGTPEQVAATQGSHTGAALREGVGEWGSGGVGESGGEGAMAGLPGRAVLAEPEPLRLTGAATHNLRAIDVEIPAGKITAVTGVSGSGKSSLALDTIVAEGQRRYTACLSTYARRFLRQARRGEVERISGLSPVLAIGHQRQQRNPRSTLGTLTGILDDLRLLYARVGLVEEDGMRVEDGVKGREGERESGGVGEKSPHRLIASSPHRSRSPGPGVPRTSKQSPPTLTARHFSFNHHLGACEACRGLGAVTRCDPARLVSRPDRSLVDGAMDGHKAGAHYGDPLGQHVATLQEVGRCLGLDFTLPWDDLSARARQVAMEGTAERAYEVTWRYRRARREGQHRWTTTWAGFAHLLEEEYQRKHADGRGAAMLPLMRDVPCPACQGQRLRPEVLAVSVGGVGLGALCAMSVVQAARFIRALDGPGELMTPASLAVSAQLRRRLMERLDALDEVGLSYLALQRQVSTLSRGEAQRARLASALGSGLAGLTYVLDEPTVGLHERDTRRLMAIMRRLCQEGNTVIVVEHDAGVIAGADHVLDLGPGAGEDGGRLVYAGPPRGLSGCEGSRTGRRLGRGAAPTPGDRRTLVQGITIREARANNLRGFDLHIPAGGIVAVTGVSGSGKSSLVLDTLLASATESRPVGCSEVLGLSAFGQVIAVDQRPVSGPANSNPATYCGAYDAIRRIFAGTEQARRLGLSAARFSLARKGGRCEDCHGEGTRRIGMGFLSDVLVTCDTCRGARFDDQTLGCRHQGQDIAGVLQLTVQQTLEFFAGTPQICSRLEQLTSVGLGYLRLGQQTRTLSSGEAQRLKLSSRLSGHLTRGGPGGDLLLFDEPTTGLHLEDVDLLLGVFNRLADAGHSLLIIEHHPEVMARADWIIDLGPEGGQHGGAVVGQGTPEELVGQEGSHTGQVLRSIVGKIKTGPR